MFLHYYKCIAMPLGAQHLCSGMTTHTSFLLVTPVVITTCFFQLQAKSYKESSSLSQQNDKLNTSSNDNWLFCKNIKEKENNNNNICGREGIGFGWSDQ